MALRMRFEMVEHVSGYVRLKVLLSYEYTCVFKYLFAHIYFLGV